MPDEPRVPVTTPTTPAAQAAAAEAAAQAAAPTPAPAPAPPPKDRPPTFPPGQEPSDVDAWMTEWARVGLVPGTMVNVRTASGDVSGTLQVVLGEVGVPVALALEDIEGASMLVPWHAVRSVAIIAEAPDA